MLSPGGGQRGASFLPHIKKGARIFLPCVKGGQKKLTTGGHRQTPPLPVKNDSSLNMHSLLDPSQVCSKICAIYMRYDHEKSQALIMFQNSKSNLAMLH